MVEGYWKARLGLLPAKRPFEFGVAAVNHDPVTGDIHRCKKREPHDVVPVQVRHKYVISLRRRRSEAGEHVLPERPGAAAHVANDVTARLVIVERDFHTRRVTAKRAGNVKAQLLIDEARDGVFGVERLADRPGECGQQLLADLRRGDRYRDGTPRAPEAKLHACLLR